MPSPRGLATVDPVQLDHDELAALHRYGPYGDVVARRAGQGDCEAIYEAAVLLGPHHGHKAVGYLLNAAAAGQNIAYDLVPLPGDRIDPRLALTHARLLAHSAKHSGDHEAVDAFRACAARYEDYAAVPREG
ncbi:hypothetical protein ETD96_36495 [Actinomadura geliboluensis]|uniref:Tetratricopeptide repeat protein n=1 Tax=Actinomadura geliboluensis TaxID=882440 RepID=A0A5S4G7H4_9ACTN|nr:hypothetical protein ETD96_36495 [Actinomadura geliboluensis]